MIDKIEFCKAIESLRLQKAHDFKSGELIKEAFGSEISLIYNNDKLILTVIDLLSTQFDRSELEHYIFDLNFGKPAPDSDWITPEELYEQLIK